MRSYLALSLMALLGADDVKPPAAPDQVQNIPTGVPRRSVLDRIRGNKPSRVPPQPKAEKPAAPPVAGEGPAIRRDPPVTRAQAPGMDALQPLPPAASVPVASDPVATQSLSMEAALYGAITSNPDVVALRGNTAASAEAVEVARRFPTTLNPTLWVDVRPLAYERVPPQHLGNGGVIPQKLDQKDALMYFSLRQPIELGHQTTHRHEIAKAAYSQQQWNVVQAELVALVQTYRFFQTAAYRREKLRVAGRLAEFNDRLVETLRRRLEAGQTQPADVALAEVESQATRQLVEAARQDYASALSDLQNQLGRPETAGEVEPLGEFILPNNIPQIEDGEYIRLALSNRPDIHAARSAVNGAAAAVRLAKGDKIPTPVVGPVYERDEQGTQFFGFVYITPLPVLNNGQPLVRQREAEHRRACLAVQQLEQKAMAQVKAAVAKWNGANRLVNRTSGLPEAVSGQIASMEKLFEAGQTDLTKLLQARRSMIQLENALLDAIWQATQAQADLLTALGTPSLISALQAKESADQASSKVTNPPAP